MPLENLLDPDCIFCKIILGELPSFKVLEDEHTLAFMDINPVAEGHVLVIPKHHAKNLYETPDFYLSSVASTVKIVANAVNKTFKPDGISITQANGPGAAQSVLHYHCHIVPRWNNDELKINWGLMPGDMDEIGNTAAKIRQNLG